MKYRFLEEYANHIKRQYLKADMPKDMRNKYHDQIDRIVRNVHLGMITLTDAMESLVKADRWINDYIHMA